MLKDLQFDEREIAEIKHALYYAKNLHHGTVGHNLLMLLGKIADAMGFYLDEKGALFFEGDTVQKLVTYRDWSALLENEEKEEE